jgi:hypothetical protein
MGSSSGSAEPSFLAATLAVAWKELRTSLRDRQTTLYTLVLPIVLYPFLFWCMIQASLFVEGRREHTEVRVGIALEQRNLEASGLAEALERPQESGAAAELDRVRVVSSKAPSGREEARAWVAPDPSSSDPSSSDPGGARASPDAPDAVVYLGRGADGERAGVEVLYDSSSPASQIALARVQKRIPEFVRDLRARSAEAAGQADKSLEPFRREPARTSSRSSCRSSS